MDAKHQFKYTYNETDLEEYSPHEITFEMPGEATLDQMLNNFESYLKACGFVFEGTLQIVDDTFNIMDELDGTLYEFDEEEPKGGCMADWDKEDVHIDLDQLYKKENSCCGGGCGCEDEYYKSKKLKEWSEGLAKLEQEIKEERDMRENISKRADELKQMEERWKEISNEEKASILAEALKVSGIDEVKKNNWVHGICNPPSPDWKAQNKS